jgi:hypothetical protein
VGCRQAAADGVPPSTTALALHAAAIITNPHRSDFMNKPETVLSRKSDRMRSGGMVAAGVLACVLALSPAALLASNNDSKDTQTQQRDKGDRKGAPDEKSAAKAPSEFETCKRDADGMKGPERSRFMTACLKERK